MVSKNREKFGGRLAVILAMAGSAIGLGNIWRFPYMAGEHGGAAFVFVYILATLLISLPVFLAEVMIGRRSHTNARDAFARLSRHHPFWKTAGYLTILIPTLIACYYSVIGGWSVSYFIKSCSLAFVHTAPEEVSGLFGSFVSSAWAPVLMHLLFLAITVGVVAGGVKSGIEKFSKIAIPLLFVLVLVIMFYSLSLPGSMEGVSYLVVPDFSKVTGHTFVDALGQSFYSLSLGMGIVITYSSYVSKQENLMVTGFGTSVCDLLFAYLAGFAIMPAVFAAGIAPGSGPGLIFDTLPSIFAQMGLESPVLSSLAAILFFLTILFAALTSSVSLMEVGVAYITERRGWSRRAACVALLLGCGVLGSFAALSFGPLAGVKLFNLPLFDFADSFASNVLLMVGGVICVVLAGWVMPRKAVFSELTNGGSLRRNVKLFPLVYFLLRYLAPLGILAMILSLVL